MLWTSQQFLRIDVLQTMVNTCSFIICMLLSHVFGKEIEYTFTSFHIGTKKEYNDSGQGMMIPRKEPSYIQTRATQLS
jgi:hypothetical protein